MAIRFLMVAFALVALVACGDGAGNFPGTYSMAGSETLTLSAPQPRTATMAVSAPVSITSGSSGGIVITVDGCSLNATVNSGTAATINPGQRCAGTGSAAGATVAVSSGTATLSGATLSLSFAASLSGVVQGVTIAGTYSYSATGTRR